MFVVRLSGPSREDWKAFGKRDDAFQRFAQARRQIIDDELDDVRAVMFQVPGEADARRAVERIKSGDPDVIMVEKAPLNVGMTVTFRSMDCLTRVDRCPSAAN